MHMKFEITKKRTFAFGGERHVAGDGVFFEGFAVCVFGRESDTFCNCFHFVLALGSRVVRCRHGAPGPGRAGQVGDPGPGDPGEAEAKVYVVLGWAGRPVSSAN